MTSTMLLPLLLVLFQRAFSQLSSVETTFTLLSSTNVTTVECPTPISHLTIREYTGFGDSPTLALLWQNLRVESLPCLSSSNLTATLFTLPTPSAPGTPAAQAQPFFAIGVDNSPRRCQAFNATRRAAYYFTDDMPRFMDRFVKEGIMSELNDPKRGDVYMFSQQFDRGGVRSNTVCLYIGERVEESEQPQSNNDDPDEDDGGGSVCFPGHVLVQTPHGVKEMRNVERNDVVRGVDGWTTVVSFSHRDVHEWATFLTFEIRSGNITRMFSATPSHFIFTEHALKRTGDVKVGEQVRMVQGLGKVINVKKWTGRGVYSPLTMDGGMVVDGVVASVYTERVHWRLAHAGGLGIRVCGGEWVKIFDWLRWAFG